MPNTEVTILVVDDDELDVRATKHALRQQAIGNPVQVAANGVEALALLRGQGPAPPLLRRPYLILLDLRMPRMNGLQFLDEVRGDPALRDSLVFVVTTSDSDRDIDAAYRHNVAGYILKKHLRSQAGAMLHSFIGCVSFPSARQEP